MCDPEEPIDRRRVGGQVLLLGWVTLAVALRDGWIQAWPELTTLLLNVGRMVRQLL